MAYSLPSGLQSGLRFAVYSLVYSLQSGYGLRFTVWFTVYSLVYRVVYGLRLTVWFTDLEWFTVYGLQSGLQFTVWFTEWFTVYSLVYSLQSGLRSGFRFGVYGLRFLQSGICVVHGFRLKFAVHSNVAVHFRSEQHMSFDSVLKADFIAPTLARSRRRNLELQSI